MIAAPNRLRPRFTLVGHAGKTRRGSSPRAILAAAVMSQLTDLDAYVPFTSFLFALLIPLSDGSTASPEPTMVVIQPEIRTVVLTGRARVLVEIRLDEPSAANDRQGLIFQAQEGILARLPAPHAAVTRRYSSIPLLGLEIDDVALQLLETMPDLVASVKLDQTLRPQ